MKIRALLVIHKDGKDFMLMYKRNNVLGLSSMEIVGDPDSLEIEFTSKEESDLAFTEAIIETAEEIDLTKVGVTIKIVLSNLPQGPGESAATLTLGPTSDSSIESRMATVKTWLSTKFNIKL